MTCAICRSEVLPHQCAHAGPLAVCFECGPSSYDPPFVRERHAGVPIYALLLRVARVELVTALWRRVVGTIGNMESANPAVDCHSQGEGASMNPRVYPEE